MNNFGELYFHQVKYTPVELEQVRGIFREYAEFLQVDLCFQDFENELKTLHKVYSPPNGCIILAKSGDEVLGCIAVKPIAEGVCEMKRLYVRPSGRGQKLGRKLVENLIEFARSAGHKKMKLDTLTTLKEAVELYKSMGFVETSPYVFNPLSDVLYFEINL